MYVKYINIIRLQDYSDFLPFIKNQILHSHCSVLVAAREAIREEAAAAAKLAAQRLAANARRLECTYLVGDAATEVTVDGFTVRLSSCDPQHSFYSPACLPRLVSLFRRAAGFAAATQWALA